MLNLVPRYRRFEGLQKWTLFIYYHIISWNIINIDLFRLELGRWQWSLSLQTRKPAVGKVPKLSWKSLRGNKTLSQEGSIKYMSPPLAHFTIAFAHLSTDSAETSCKRPFKKTKPSNIKIISYQNLLLIKFFLPNKAIWMQYMFVYLVGLFVGYRWYG